MGIIRSPISLFQGGTKVLSITLRSEGPGHCIWCDKDKEETTDVKFGDGSFDGPMCDPCFKRAKRNRLRLALTKQVTPKEEAKKP